MTQTKRLHRTSWRRDHDPPRRDRSPTIAPARKPRSAPGESAEDGYLIPVATMVGANLHGGLVLGAFLPSGEAVAMSFAFLGRIEGPLCLYSQLTGVVPELPVAWSGLRDQAAFSARSPVPRASSASPGPSTRFRPATPISTSVGWVPHAARYVENMYGERTDRLNAGVPTDRLIAEWDLSPDPLPRSFSIPSAHFPA